MASENGLVPSTVRLPEGLAERISQLSKSMYRTRNAQIVLLLEQAVALTDAAETPILAAPKCVKSDVSSFTIRIPQKLNQQILERAQKMNRKKNPELVLLLEYAVDLTERRYSSTSQAAV